MSCQSIFELHYYTFLNNVYYFRFVYSELFKLFGWKQVASLTEDCNKYSEYLTLLQNMLPKGVNLVNRKFPRAAKRNMTDVIP